MSLKSSEVQNVQIRITVNRQHISMHQCSLIDEQMTSQLSVRESITSQCGMHLGQIEKYKICFEIKSHTYLNHVHKSLVIEHH